MADIGQIKVRLPERLRTRLERASDKSGRSLNNEIVWRLMKSFEAKEPETELAAATEMAELVKDVLGEVLDRELEKRGIKP
jgi:hypothetical protein